MELNIDIEIELIEPRARWFEIRVTEPYESEMTQLCVPVSLLFVAEEDRCEVRSIPRP